MLHKELFSPEVLLDAAAVVASSFDGEDVVESVEDVVAVDDVHFADDGDPVDSLGVHFPRREQIRFSDFEEGSKTRRRRRGRCCRFGRVS